VVTQKAVDEGLVRKDSVLLKTAAELAKLRKKPKEKPPSARNKKQWTEEPKGEDTPAPAEQPDRPGGETKRSDDKDVDDGTQEGRGEPSDGGVA
jgi:hypothetical protein